MATDPEVLPSITETESRQPVDLLKAYKLRVQHNLTYQQIADATGQPKSSIHRALTDLCDLIADPQRLKHYEDARPQLFGVVEERLMQSLVDEEKIAKASLNNVAYAFKQIHEARRLETGQSTNNISVLGKFLLQAEERLGAAPASKQSVQAPAQEEPK